MKDEIIGDTDENKRFFEQIFYSKPKIKRSKWCRRIFFLLWENGPIRPKDLQKHLMDLDTGRIREPVLHRCLKQLINEDVVTKLESEGKKTLYNLAFKYRTREFDQIIYFNKIREQEKKDSMVFSDVGIPGYFWHTIYGLPKIENMTDYEGRIVEALLMQINDAFEGLQKLKIVYELRKKVETGWLSRYKFPYGIISEELSLKLLLAHFTHRLNSVLETESGNEKSYRFFARLIDEVCNISRKMDFNICKNNSPYPEKIFYSTFPHNFLFDYLFMCHPEIPGSYSELFGNKFDYKPFEMIKNNTWFFDRKDFMTFEKLERESSPYHENFQNYDKSYLIDHYERKTKSKFYSKSLPIFESIALLSTHSLEYSRDVKTSIELKLDRFFKQSRLFKGEIIDKSQIWSIINKSESLLNEALSCKRKWNRDALSRHKFLHNKYLKENFSEDVIKFLLSVIDFIIDELKEFNFGEIELALVYKGFEEEGLWYDENKKFFYKIAKEILQKINPHEFINLGKFSRFEEIREMIMKHPDTSLSLKKDKKGKYGLNNLIIFIEAKSYFEKIRPIKRKIEKEFWNEEKSSLRRKKSKEGKK